MFTKKDLDPAGCAIPDCGHDHSEIFLHSKCHPHAPVWVKYVKASGAMEIICAHCEQPIASIKVAEE